MSESVNHLMRCVLAMPLLALAAMMMPAAGFSTTNPPGGSSTCTNSCDCHRSFSNDALTTLISAAPRAAPVTLGATRQNPGVTSYYCLLYSGKNKYYYCRGPLKELMESGCVTSTYDECERVDGCYTEESSCTRDCDAAPRCGDPVTSLQSV